MMQSEGAAAAAPVASFPFRHSAAVDGDVDALAQALAAETLSGESEWVDHYEVALARHFGAAHAVALSSGTAALHLALQALGAGPGTEVLVPATAPLPSLLPILAAGATPVVVDVATDHLGFHLDDLERKIGPATRAALAVLLWGYPQHLAAAAAVLERHGVPLVEDACQAHGTTVGGRPAGTIGRVGCFSTHDYKLLSTGEGGFILTGDAELAASVRQRSRLGGLDGVHAGLNYKLSGLAAALGLHRLGRLDGRVADQRRGARRLLAAVRSPLLSELPAAPYGESNYYSLVLLADLPVAAVRRAADALALHGLATDKLRFGYDLVYRRPLFAAHAADCPNAARLVDHALQLPCHPGLDDAALDAIGAIVSQAVEEAAE